MSVFDFKKNQEFLYSPKDRISIVDVPAMLFVMADGHGDPNTSEEYAKKVELLYGIAYAIKMTKKSDETPPGYYDFVVPPLEGFWDLDIEGYKGGSIPDKSRFSWTMMLRLPEFVTDEVFKAARKTVSKKKPGIKTSLARLDTLTEGLCCQILHTGPYDDEPASIAELQEYIEKAGYREDMTGSRKHHEIYLSDPRRTEPARLKTILRHPIACDLP